MCDVTATPGAHSWKATFFFIFLMEDSHLTALFFSLHSTLLTQMNSALPYSFSLHLYLPLTRISPLSIHAYLPFFLYFFSFFALSSLSPYFTPSPITVKLQGGWLGTFLTEKFGSDQNHYRAFLHSFPNLNDFAASQAHPPRQPDILTLTLCKSLTLSFSFAHTHSFISLSLCLFLLSSVIQTYTYKTQFTPTSGVTGEVPTSWSSYSRFSDFSQLREQMRDKEGCSWRKRQRWEGR